MTNPVPGYGISTPYGKRGSYWSCDPDAYGNGIHTGNDHAAPTGTRVVAARPGKVVWSNHGSAFGNHQVDLLAGDGTRDFYAHMRSRVADGSQVEAGDPIGEVGSEGNVTGPHLHFERHATEYGGWSCSVVRDPAPSENYAAGASGGSGSGAGGGADPMPDYGHAQATKEIRLKAQTWTPIVWDKIPSGDVFKSGESGVRIGGSRYLATLIARVADRNGGTLRTNTVEIEGDELVESNAEVAHDQDRIQDTRSGTVGKDRVLRFRVWADKGATLTAADLVVLYW